MMQRGIALLLTLLLLLTGCQSAAPSPSEPEPTLSFAMPTQEQIAERRLTKEVFAAAADGGEEAAYAWLENLTDKEEILLLALEFCDAIDKGEMDDHSMMLFGIPMVNHLFPALTEEDFLVLLDREKVPSETFRWMMLEGYDLVRRDDVDMERVEAYLQKLALDEEEPSMIRTKALHTIPMQTLVYAETNIRFGASAAGEDRKFAEVWLEKGASDSQIFEAAGNILENWEQEEADLLGYACKWGVSRLDRFAEEERQPMFDTLAALFADGDREKVRACFEELLAYQGEGTVPAVMRLQDLSLLPATRLQRYFSKHASELLEYLAAAPFTETERCAAVWPDEALRPLLEQERSRRQEAGEPTQPVDQLLSQLT